MRVHCFEAEEKEREPKMVSIANEAANTRLSAKPQWTLWQLDLNCITYTKRYVHILYIPHNKWHIRCLQNYDIFHIFDMHMHVIICTVGFQENMCICTYMHTHVHVCACAYAHTCTGICTCIFWLQKKDECKGGVLLKIWEPIKDLAWNFSFFSNFD